ncbi:threonine--tRNA ligase [Candidatus Saccharibacteria bacterium]|nr:threonine--tRNA ligase [Candidatus Saccharibacteria bacterium]
MEKLAALRHSLAHILASALQTTYPDKVKFGTGPDTETGFYYDVFFDGVDFMEKDLKTIEKQMWKIVNQNLEIKYFEKPVDQALAWAKGSGQTFKHELISDLKAEGEKTVDFYQIGDFIDLCKGPHLAHTGEVPKGSFKLTRIGGAYWRASESREQMTRVSGIAFESEKELKAYLDMMAEAEKRDHRKLGKELDLFTFSPLVGAGLPLFTMRGGMLRKKFEDFSLSLRAKAGFERVWTPHITKIDLYKTSGHWDKFGDELFMVESKVNGEQFAMKPMNCPHHTQIYASRPRSYRDLPIRMMESTTDYRDEKTGELGGLSRVRSLTQDDSHVFCRHEQIKTEVSALANIVKNFYSTIGMNDLRARLSYRDDSDGYLGEQAIWDEAQKQIKELAIENKLEFFEAEGEAAFYGPKIDFMARDAIGREHQVATIQLDFVMPGRFGLEFVNEEGKKETPVMIHHATMGSTERFLSVFIEHTAGHFPFWCAPEQIRILPINDQISDYVAKIEKVLEETTLENPLAHNDLRFTVDTRSESLGRKIKDAIAMKIPVVLILGDKDKEEGVVSIRLKDKEEKVKLSDLANYLQNLK